MRISDWSSDVCSSDLWPRPRREDFWMSEDRMIKVEEVESVEAPPKARVVDAETAPEKLERKRDYLEGFLAAKPAAVDPHGVGGDLYEAVINARSEEHTSELQSLMRISYAVFCLKKKTKYNND